MYLPVQSGGVYCPRMSCREKRNKTFSQGFPVVCLLEQTLVERGDGSGLHRDSDGSGPAQHCEDVWVGEGGCECVI